MTIHVPSMRGSVPVPIPTLSLSATGGTAIATGGAVSLDIVSTVAGLSHPSTIR